MAPRVLRRAPNEPDLIVMLVLTLIIGGQQYERDVSMDSIDQCQSEATRVINEAANVRVATTTDAAEIGAGCVIKINPGNPA
jgi:hypothetical protein